jgi:hypothetical protein
MKIPELRECVGADKTVTFVKCESGDLTYVCDSNGFEFKVPYIDTMGATFKAADKSVFFMRWIRREIEERKRWLEEGPLDETDHAV